MYFHIPDFQKNLRLNLLLIDYLKHHPEVFWDDLRIDSIFDSFPLIWNGGRLIPGEFSENIAKKTISCLNESGVKCAFTFTNSLLQEEHLIDKDCNTLMDMAKGNTIILNSPLLENYIREKYDGYDIVLSTTRQLSTVEQVNEALRQDYRLVVLDYNMNHDWEVLEQLEDKSRCELLVNACCRDNCPQRKEHYTYISKRQLELHDNIPENEQDKFHCRGGNYEYFQFKHFKNFISIEEIREKYIPMGFQHFKLEGRGSNTLHLLEQYVQYLVKPQHRDETRYRMLQKIFS